MRSHEIMGGNNETDDVSGRFLRWGVKIFQIEEKAYRILQYW